MRCDTEPRRERGTERALKRGLPEEAAGGERWKMRYVIDFPRVALAGVREGRRDGGERGTWWMGSVRGGKVGIGKEEGRVLKVRRERGDVIERDRAPRATAHTRDSER